ncbi:MAG: hypothetical protein LBH85_05435 [Treponema sp.]|nr:hypothetical protein [Treponema sp.]
MENETPLAGIRSLWRVLRGRPPSLTEWYTNNVAGVKETRPRRDTQEGVRLAPQFARRQVILRTDASRTNRAA